MCYTDIFNACFKYQRKFSLIGTMFLLFQQFKSDIWDYVSFANDRLLTSVKAVF